MTGNLSLAEVGVNRYSFLKMKSCRYVYLNVLDSKQTLYQRNSQVIRTRDPSSVPRDQIYLLQVILHAATNCRREKSKITELHPRMPNPDRFKKRNTIQKTEVAFWTFQDLAIDMTLPSVSQLKRLKSEPCSME